MQKALLPMLLLIWACNPKERFKDLPSGPIKHHLIVLAKTKDGARAKGFMGATPFDTEISLSVDGIPHTIRSGSDGSFDLHIKLNGDTPASLLLTFTHQADVYRQSYRVKDLSRTLADISKRAFVFEKEVSSLAFLPAKAAILSSTASSIYIHAIDEFFRLSNRDSAILLNKNDLMDVGAHQVASIGDRLVVTLFNTHEVGLMEPDNFKVLDRKRLLKGDHPPLFDVTPPLSLKNPIDANGNGTLSNTISRSAARNAQAILAVDNDHVLVSFVNYYQFADPSLHERSVVGPGIVALMKINGDVLTTLSAKPMPFKNPTHILKKDDKNFWILCAGAWQYDQNSFFNSTDAGLVQIKLADAKNDILVEHQIDLGDFSPAEPAIVSNKIIIPRSWKNEVAIIDESANAISDSDIVSPRYGDGKFYFTVAAHWHDDVLFLGDATGSLIAFHLHDGFFPFPFIKPIAINPKLDASIFSGVHQVYFRHQVEGYDLKVRSPMGYSAWAVSQVENKIYPLDFLSVFGP